MDEMVRKAMAKWPHVPACVGWLGLDGRGQWWMRDDAAQASMCFQDACRQPDAQSKKGSKVLHPALEGFINRNYQPDTEGRWYFQNGPQQVFVELDLAPLVCRVDPLKPTEVTLHTGVSSKPQQMWVDECGTVYLVVDEGLAQVHTQDMHAVADWVDAGHWHPQACRRVDMPRQFGFVRSPQRQSLGQDAIGP